MSSITHTQSTAEPEEKAFKDEIFAVMKKHGVTMECKQGGEDYYATDEYYFKGPNFLFTVLPQEFETFDI